MSPLLTLAELSGAFVVVMAAIGVISRSRPGRWLWRHTVSGPFGEWVGKQQQPTYDRLDEGELRFDNIDGRLMALNDAVKPTNGDDRTISDRVDEIKTRVTANTDNIQLLAEWTQNFKQFDAIDIEDDEQETG